MTRRADNSGILLLLTAILFVVTMNTIAKYLSNQGLPPLQLVWARFTFHLATALPLVALLAPKRLLTTRPVFQVGRSAILMTMTFCFFFGLALLPLAEVTAMMFAAPFFLTCLSVLILREAVGLRRWAGVAVGFVGIFMILKPSLSMNPYYLVPLAAAFLYAFYQLSTRIISGDDHSVTTLLYTPVAGTAVASAIMPFVWVPPDALNWVLLVSLGMLGAAGHYLIIMAYHRSEASLLAPFGYSSMLWATLAGWMVFDSLPDAWTFAGAALIIASGLYIWYREQKRLRDRAPVPEAEAAP